MDKPVVHYASGDDHQELLNFVGCHFLGQLVLFFAFSYNFAKQLEHVSVFIEKQNVERIEQLLYRIGPSGAVICRVMPEVQDDVFIKILFRQFGLNGGFAEVIDLLEQLVIDIRL